MHKHELSSDIRTVIAACLYDQKCACWFPGLARRLVEDYWLQLRIPSADSKYSTANALGDHSARFITQLDSKGVGNVIMVETLCESHVRSYEQSGLTLVPHFNITSDNLEILSDALQALGLVQDLATTVGSLVRSLHLLAAPSDEYDVSHSEPSLPFSIFVSVPTRATPINTIRVAESLVHEAMHLQLTLIETRVPLLTNTDRLAYSPWRDEERPLRGVIHGFYVFCVTLQYLYRLESNASMSCLQRDFIQHRRKSILAEMRLVPDLSSYTELTPAGIALFQKLVGSINL